jgi:DNA (cytosine-5)-methyltransferase 1
VLEARFPGVPIYPDVRDLDPAEVEAVDVLTGGSPCQGFSIAGTRSGLEHSESRLFADYVRIMDGLADRGLKYAVWENVPGVLSIRNEDGERTFTHVIGALVGADNPVRLDPDRKWNTGLAAGSGRAVAWRVLDSRYFGVAQRRRRVFACVAFGDSAADRAGRALLAVSEGLRGDSPSGLKAGEGVAGGFAGRAGVPSFAGTVSAKLAKGTGGPSGDEVQNLVTDAPQAFNWQQGDAEYSLRDDSSALAADSRPAVLLPQAFRKSRRAQSNTDDETWVADGGANTLNVFDVGDTRTTHAIVEPPTYGVRRLTPVECERLQSFPDGWTEPSGSDSARYKAMGNAVTVNVVRWILGRLP